MVIDKIKNLYRSKKTLLSVIAILSILTILFTVFSDWISREPKKDSVSARKSINTGIDIGIFKKYKFTQLTTFVESQIRVKPSDLGRDNPFINYRQVSE